MAVLHHQVVDHLDAYLLEEVHLDAYHLEEDHLVLPVLLALLDAVRLAFLLAALLAFLLGEDHLVVVTYLDSHLKVSYLDFDLGFLSEA